MALLDFLKRKKEVEKAKEKKEVKKSEIKSGKASDAKPVVKEIKKQALSAKIDAKPTLRKQKDFSYNVIKQPHVSEKAAYLAEGGQYTFKVSSNFNKSEIKKAVEGIYGVNVLSVNMIKIPSKKRRLGKVQGYKKGFTKAIVKISKGQKIEIL